MSEKAENPPRPFDPEVEGQDGGNSVTVIQGRGDSELPFMPEMAPPE